jgi:hypothetical protein
MRECRREYEKKARIKYEQTIQTNDDIEKT